MKVTWCYVYPFPLPCLLFGQKNGHKTASCSSFFHGFLVPFIFVNSGFK